MTEPETSESREERRSRQRRPETYASVTEWWADYRGFVPIAMAHGLSQLMAKGMSFHDAYLSLVEAGGIVEIDPWPRPASVTEALGAEHEPPEGGIGARTRALNEAVRRAPNEMSATIGLPDEITGGTFGFTFMADPWRNGEATAYAIRFDWEPGAREATWWQDISEHEGITPFSYAPSSGWASWRNGNDLLLAFASADLEVEAWARVPGAAPTAGADDDLDDKMILADPKRWVAFARVITAVIVEQDLPGMTSERYE